MIGLLDVNALIALIDQDHVSHGAMQRWFSNYHRSGWATCPITENGVVRVISQPAYPSGKRNPSEITEVLKALKTTFQLSHHFWPDDVSISDESLFDSALVATSRQVTDIYLLGLAAKHGGVLVSFDRGLIWQAVQGASAQLIHRPE